MPDHDRTAERYVDKIFPSTREYAPSTAELKHDRIDPAIYERLQSHISAFTRETGRQPTIDEITAMETNRLAREARRGI